MRAGARRERVDTAECYGDHLAEALIGGAIRQQRGDPVVATKCGHRFHPEAVQHGSGSPARLRTDHWTPTEVVASWRRRCRRSPTDHLDIYQIHSDSDEVVQNDRNWR